jgi:hypothetical protein
MSKTSIAMLALLASCGSAFAFPQIHVFSATSSPAQHAVITVSVPTDYKIISGGARVNYTGAGNILTKSFPQGNTWRAESKDMDIADPSTITAWAIAIHDPKNEWEVCFNQKTSAAAPHPTIHVQLRADCALTGGGASANWTGAGSYLVSSSPDTDHGWFAAAKDHINPDPSTLTVFVLGVRARTGASPTSQVFTSTFSNNPVPHPTGSMGVPAGFTLVGGGATDNWAGEGNMLTASNPDSTHMDSINKWLAAGKDHERPSPATITVFAIGLQ